MRYAAAAPTNAHALLRATHLCTDHAVHAQACVARDNTQLQLRIGRQTHPFGNEFLHLHRPVEQLLQQGAQAFRRTRSGTKTAGVVATCIVGQCVALTQMRAGDTHQRIQPGAELIARLPLGLHAGLRLRPGAVEQAQHTVMEHIGECGKGAVLGLLRTLDGVFGQVQWQRCIGAE